MTMTAQSDHLAKQRSGGSGVVVLGFCLTGTGNLGMRGVMKAVSSLERWSTARGQRSLDDH